MSCIINYCIMYYSHTYVITLLNSEKEGGNQIDMVNFTATCAKEILNIQDAHGNHRHLQNYGYLHVLIKQTYVIPMKWWGPRVHSEHTWAHGHLQHHRHHTICIIHQHSYINHQWNEATPRSKHNMQVHPFCNFVLKTALKLNPLAAH